MNCKFWSFFFQLICTVTPSSSNSEETHNTLKFAHRAKHIEIQAAQNKVWVFRLVFGMMELRKEWNRSFRFCFAQWNGIWFLSLCYYKEWFFFFIMKWNEELQYKTFLYMWILMTIFFWSNLHLPWLNYNFIFLWLRKKYYFYYSLFEV